MTIKALVVDNNKVILKAVETILIQEGCVVKAVPTGLAALENLETFLPDIVFTDLVMPLVDGEQLCGIIKNTHKYSHIFVVVLSGIVVEDQERILRDVACDVCIAKGTIAEIRDHLKEALLAYGQRGDGSGVISGKDTHIPKRLKPSMVASELLLAKQYYRDVISNVHEGILELNCDGKIIAANRSVLEILQCREEEIIGKYFPEIKDWDVYNRTISDWTKEQLVKRGMESFEIKEDSPLICGDKFICASLIPVNAEDMVFGLGIFRDISRQFNAERRHRGINDAIRLAKKMDAMSCMAGGVAHDFNNLLTVICGNLDILSMDYKELGENSKNTLVDEAKNAALVAVDLTRQISCFSNLGIIQREILDADLLIKQAVEEFFQDAPQATFTYTSNLALKSISVDSEEMTTAVHNILKNCTEAQENVAVTLRVDNLTFTRPELMQGQYITAGNYVRVTIADNGPGLDEDETYKIFNPYFSTKERGATKGVGLGLTIVYATMRNHGGNVIVSSLKDTGTTVTLYIPVNLQSEVTSVLSVKKNRAEIAALLIDADPQMLEMGKIMLKYLGLKILSASDISEAIEMLNDLTEGDKEHVSLAIIDITGITGDVAARTCRTLRKYDTTIKIVAMCGTILDPIMEEYNKYGFDHTLAKPYTVDSLQQVINKAIAN